MIDALPEVMQSVVTLTSHSIMPAHPDRIAITVRADPKQHEAWVAAASRDGRPLSQWLARNADIAAGYEPQVKTRKKPRRKRAT